MDNDAVVRGFLPEQGKAKGEVFVIEEDPLSLIAALDNVVEEVRLEVAVRPWHGGATASDGPNDLAGR